MFEWAPRTLVRVQRVSPHSKKTDICRFSNKTDVCDWVSEFLTESGISNVNLSGSMLLKHRKGSFKRFQDDEETVLVTTSLGSRGLDTKQVGHRSPYTYAVQ